MLITKNGKLIEYAHEVKYGVLNNLYGAAGTDRSNMYACIAGSASFNTLVSSADSINTSHVNNFIEFTTYINESNQLLIKCKVNFGPETYFYTGSQPSNFNGYTKICTTYSDTVATGDVGYIVRNMGNGTASYYKITLNNNGFTISSASSQPNISRAMTMVTDVAVPSSLNDTITTLENTVNDSISNLTQTVSNAIEEVEGSMSQIRSDLTTLNDEVLGTQAKIKSAYISR